MPIRVYRPRIEVKVRKLVRRNGDGEAERFTGANREFDLTPFLSEGGGIKIVKGLTEAAGAFQINFGDKVDQATRDSIYARVEAMDLLEIRGAREPQAGQLPLIMRGLVSSVRRTEAMGEDGTPQRSVAITGQDFGKVLLMFRVFWQAIFASANEPTIGSFRFQAVNGMTPSFVPVGDAMQSLFLNIVNRRLADLAAYTEQQIPAFRVRSSVPEGVVSPNTLSEVSGPYWQIAELICDRPWNELFIEDEEAGPVAIFRPTPFRDLTGQFIMPGAADPGTIEITDQDVVRLDVGRSDQRIANWFYVDPARSSLLSGQLITVQNVATGIPLDRNHGNNRPELYGIRVMEHSSMLQPSSERESPRGQQAAAQAATQTQLQAWYLRRANQLRDMNRDNSVLEEGSATLLGRETLKIGRYLRIRRGSVTAEHYITRITHDITPLDGWTTTVALIRGTGFRERLRAAGSPYWGEGRPSAYGT